MKAVVVNEGRLTVEELPAPSPARGQVLLNVTRTGICGSDLHARHHADLVADLAAKAGYPDCMRTDQRVVMGHEFVGTVAEYGPGCRKRWPVGTRVVALPTLMVGNEPQLVGLSERSPGSYAEQVLVQESMTMPVPGKVSDEEAALTEPMAVAWHAVRRAEVGRGQTAIVIGCGPIGLAVIAMLRASGAKKIIASDFSPGRRALAKQMGAHVVVDPRVQEPWNAYKQPRTEIRKATDLFKLGVSTMDKLTLVPGPVPWWHVFRLADKIGEMPSGPVVFECVGVPGMINSIIEAAPLRTRVIVVGVCMEPDQIMPALAGNKEIDLRFAFGYDPGEFHDTLHMIANGKVDVKPLVTGTVGLEGVATAFDALGDPEVHAKILIDPSSTATAP
ncbi:zinc-binding dehydrogenase [Tsukamurella asaccharolytica]|uniref:Zinc-binding dehydrogenase n=1 Tax=Tsukamurella asaccharolytica TaxID=2592067 RepID=A0A5C5R709_9ACTN|nr:zinc-binding dehydrogenase [Tsukamurella asaccharolytica]TWS18402.1 zinc-binding dehydrogenase [Tsukamurella asaccharolytica]